MCFLDSYSDCRGFSPHGRSQVLPYRKWICDFFYKKYPHSSPRCREPIVGIIQDDLRDTGVSAKSTDSGISAAEHLHRVIVAVLVGDVPLVIDKSEQKLGGDSSGQQQLITEDRLDNMFHTYLAPKINAFLAAYFYEIYMVTGGGDGLFACPEILSPAAIPLALKPYAGIPLQPGDNVVLTQIHRDKELEIERLRIQTSLDIAKGNHDTQIRVAEIQAAASVSIAKKRASDKGNKK